MRDRVSPADRDPAELRALWKPSSSASESRSSTDVKNSANFQALEPSNEPLLWDWLFDASAEGVLIIDTVSERVIEVNPAAATLLGTKPEALAGSPLPEAFDTGSAPAVRASLARARTEGAASARGVRAFRGAELNFEVSLFQTQLRSYLLVNIALHAQADVGHEAHVGPSAAFCALDNASVALLVTDSSFQVEYANKGFLALIMSRSQPCVIGTPLVRWLGLSAAQLADLGEQFQSRCAIGDVMTRLCPEQGAPRPVTVSVVAVPDGPIPLWGFCVREARLH